MSTDPADGPVQPVDGDVPDLVTTDPVTLIQEMMKRQPLSKLLMYQMAAANEIAVRLQAGVVKEKEATRKAFEKVKREYFP